MPQYELTSGLPQLPSSGLNPDQFALVQPLYQAVNTLTQKLATESGLVTYEQTELAERNQLASLSAQNRRKIYPLALAKLDFGKLVNLTLSGAKLAARLADATSGLPAHGIVNEPYGITSGQYGEVVLLEGFSVGVSGTVLGSFYYLHNTGNIALAPPSGAPVSQRVGVGFGSAGFYMNIQAPS